MALNYVIENQRHLHKLHNVHVPTLELKSTCIICTRLVTIISILSNANAPNGTDITGLYETTWYIVYTMIRSFMLIRSIYKYIIYENEIPCNTRSGYRYSIRYLLSIIYQTNMTGAEK